MPLYCLDEVDSPEIGALDGRLILAPWSDFITHDYKATTDGNDLASERGDSGYKFNMAINSLMAKTLKNKMRS